VEHRRHRAMHPRRHRTRQRQELKRTAIPQRPRATVSRTPAARLG
jgi:hypothetical protein